jgi:hypothetical protein
MLRYSVIFYDIASKALTLVGAIVVYLYVDLIVSYTQYPIALPISLWFEGLVFVNAATPLGLMSILSAKSVIADQSWGWLFIGYMAALSANLLSYWFGTIMPKLVTDHENPAAHRTFALTYWHPQLASLTAFSQGVRRIPVRAYLSKALPWSILWFGVACFVIATLLEEINSADFAQVGLIGLIGWILFDLARLFFREQSSERE